MPLLAQKDADARLKAATEDLQEMMNASDKGIPQDLISKASCVVVIPNQKSGDSLLAGSMARASLPAGKRAVSAGALQDR